MTLAVGATMQHPGPAQVYMSKAPTTAGAYDGSGYCFKIHQETICKQGADIKKEAWCTSDKDRVSFEVAQGIPDGDYLIRTEHIGFHGAHGGQAEFYYGCAQVTVCGGGNVLSTETVKSPSVYNKNDPEVNFSVWGGNNVQYPARGSGPKVFTGGASSSVSSTEKAPASGNAASSGNTPSTPTEQSPAPDAVLSAAPSAAPSAVPSADPSKCGMYARRHARDMAN
jgi:hypothetical protein